jgi:hypothetical protein
MINAFIKHCRGCGHKPAISSLMRRFRVGCTTCDKWTKSARTRDEAVKEWNKLQK